MNHGTLHYRPSAQATLEAPLWVHRILLEDTPCGQVKASDCAALSTPCEQSAAGKEAGLNDMNRAQVSCLPAPPPDIAQYADRPDRPIGVSDGSQ